MTDEICYLPAHRLASLIRTQELSPVEVTRAFLDRIQEKEGEINAYITVLEEKALEAAQNAEREIREGEYRGPLHGVPVAIKDLMGFKKGVRNSFGSVPLKDFIPEENAIFVERLEEAGSIVLGKTSTPEFGHKGNTVNEIIGSTKNPFNLEKMAGGSSGGSAAALASGMTPLAQGSDGGGSVRIPASACGVYGLKPTFGLIPHAFRPDAFEPLTPFLHLGPMARSVDDAALMLDVMVGRHPRDVFSLPTGETSFYDKAQEPIKNLNVAYSPDLDVFTIDPQVDEILRSAVDTFEVAGRNVSVEEVDLGFESSLDEIGNAFTTSWQVLMAVWLGEHIPVETDVELLGNHEEKMTPEVVAMAKEGQKINAVEFKKTDMIRTEVLDKVLNLFEEYDLLLTPTLSVPPFDVDLSGPESIAGTKINPFWGWIPTFLFNLTGHPAASIPAGFTEDGLPVGMQIVGPRLSDDLVISASAAFERVSPWNDKYQEV